MSYFPDDYLLIIDESHISVPQVGAMFKGDRSRKDKLIEYGFRLPCARDNRPLTFEEFEARMGQTIYVSATPSKYELAQSEGLVVEQVVRPTGLIDPEVEVRPASDQVDDLLGEVRIRAERGERVLVTTLTKRMAEDLTSYFTDLNVRVRYMHSDVETLERIEVDDYGWCDSCGVEIGIRRLEARPTATLCIDCKTLDEIKERSYGG